MVTADNLVWARRFTGTTGRSLASMIGVDPSYISLIETKKCPLPLKRARQIEEALGLDAEKFRLIEQTRLVLTKEGAE